MSPLLLLLLHGVRQANHRCFIEMLAQYLNSNRQPFGIISARQRDSGHPGQVRRDRVACSDDVDRTANGQGVEMGLASFDFGAFLVADVFGDPMRSMRPKRWMMRTGFQWMS